MRHAYCQEPGLHPVNIMEVHTAGGHRISFPEQIDQRMIVLKVNTVCNLRCDYCWYVINPSLHVPVREEATPAEMAEMVREISPRRGDTVYLSGGEAVLRKDIVQICHSICTAGARVYLTTNGMLRDRLLALASEVHGYVVSLDSINPTLHDAHRGGHEATVENLPYLVAVRPVCVSVVLSRENLNQLVAIADACVEWGVQSLFYQLLWFPKGMPEREVRCMRTADQGALTAALDVLDQYRDRLQLPPPAYRSLVEATVAAGGARGYVANCFAMQGYLTTDPRGGVLRCLPHDYLERGGDPHDVPWRDGVCHYLSEECTCLMGYFHTDLFDGLD